MKKVISIIGTRPEIIKMAPVIRELSAHNDIKSLTLATSQHRDMAFQIFENLGIMPDIDLDIMVPNQSLSHITSKIAERLEPVLLDLKPDLILVQGDTTSAIVCGLIAFYNKIFVGHVEAGLRTYNPLFPYPEEINRQIISRYAALNFAPTRKAVMNLTDEKVNPLSIYYTGNTVVDSLQYLMRSGLATPAYSGEDGSRRKRILVTAHRRENFGRPMANICKAINAITKEFNDIEIIFPVHPNPNVRNIVYEMMAQNKSVRLSGPLAYTELIGVMMSSTLILTDSGGIQEEAPTLHKPVLVLRNETERPEVVEAGGAILVGTDESKIACTVRELLTNRDKYALMAHITNPYGDGRAAERIVEEIRRHFNLEIDARVPPLSEYFSRA